MALTATKTGSAPPVRLEIKTYDDLLAMPHDGNRYELIHGEIVRSPSPSMKHQFVSFALSQELGSFITKHQLGALLYAPADVRFSKSSVVQPDLMYVSNERLFQMQSKFYEGAPDLAIEVLSPSNREIDLRVKAELYASYGVKEYWVVDPAIEQITVNVLRDGQFVALPPKGRLIRSEVLPGLSLNPKAIFALPPGVPAWVNEIE